MVEQPVSMTCPPSCLPMAHTVLPAGHATEFWKHLLEMEHMVGEEYRSSVVNCWLIDVNQATNIF